jgi:hypothetical protein
MTAAGCGGEAGGPSPIGYGGPDGQAIAALADLLNEYKADPARFRTLFAGLPGGSNTQYDRFGYDLDGSPVVTGGTATARVRCRPEVGTAEAVVLDWTFEKVGDKWKIKSAPLPAAKK